MPPVQNAPEPIQDLVDESFDEAVFLWHRWEGELASLTRNLDEVWSWTEDRLHGALDGVRVAGAGAVDMATEGLMSSDIDRVTVSAGVLASSIDRRATETIAGAIGKAEGPKLLAIVRGLELLGSDQSLRVAASALAAGGPAHVGALCRLKAFHRAAPGDEILTAFKSNIPEVRVTAVRAALYARSSHAEKLIAAGLSSSDAKVRYAAAESGLGRGIADAWATVIRLADQRDPISAPYLKLLAILGTAEEHEVVYAALRIPELRLQGIWALGHIGTVRAAESCLAGMRYEKLARASAEAYCWITGADLGRDHLAADEDSPEVPAFEDDDLDANLVPAAEALWPLPEPEAVQRHWLARQSEMTPDVRYIGGRPATRETLLAMVETGPMLRRPDLVLELRAKTRGRYDVETRAFTARQRQMMATGRAAISSHTGH